MMTRDSSGEEAGGSPLLAGTTPASSGVDSHHYRQGALHTISLLTCGHLARLAGASLVAKNAITRQVWIPYAAFSSPQLISFDVVKGRWNDKIAITLL